MNRNLFAALALGVVAAAVRGQPPPQRSPERGLLISGARVLNAAGDRWIDGAAIVVAGDRIAEIGPAVVLKPPEGAERIDAPGLYVISGLIDLHTHLLLRPYDEAKWDDQVLRESLELRTIRAVTHARATVESGFTTIRDLGTEGAGFADVALRDTVNAGMIPGPRIFASTRAIVATACYGPAGFDPRWDIPQGAQEATGPDEIRRAVRQQIAAGADWVKLYADYRRAPGSPGTPTFSLEELKAAVDEAASAGKPVAVHATTDEGIRRAVEAGVNTIEHGYGASRETLQLMKERGIALCPTMAAADAVARYAGWNGADPPPPGVAQSRRAFALAREVGVTIACGSDAGVFPHGSSARELELMVQAGLTPAEALRSATSIAAAVLRRQDQLGRLERGYTADLVLLRADPLADIRAVREVALVIARGRVVSGKLVGAAPAR